MTRLRCIALLVCLGLAENTRAQPVHLGVDGGVAVVDVERAELATDAGVVLVGPGVWLSADRAIEVQADRVDLRAENARLVDDIQASTLQSALLGSALGLAVGVLLGAIVAGAFKH